MRSDSKLMCEGDGFVQVMTKNLGPVVDMVLNSFRDPHPRVRWAAINTIGQLSTDLGPVLQQDYHQRVLPALVGAMDDFQNPRVQASILSMRIRFHGFLDQSSVAPCLKIRPDSYLYYRLV